MKIGVCYYPEHWPEESWKKDAEHMRALGIEVVRVGEFAWKQLEPADGDLQFDWLHRAIDTLHAAGLEIVLGTPTATPPKWLINKYPNLLAKDHNGQTRGFGSRRHYCFSSRQYREECRRIVTLMAKAFGKHPAISTWQTDNEYGCHSTSLSYSNDALMAFRLWCRSNYSSVDELNELWGNRFWSMSYGDFDEIELPNMTTTEANPAHQLAFWRFTSRQITTFNKLQVDIIREYSPGRDVVHNFMGNFTEFDHREVAADLDVATWDNYPLGFLDRDGSNVDEIEKWYRTGHPDSSAFHHDLYRGLCNGRWWIMEQQPGPVNWAPHNPSPLPGMVRLWGWEGFAHGAEVVSYFRWRQLPVGQEQMHTGVCRPNGEEDAAAGELRTLNSDIKRLQRDHRKALEAEHQAEVAIIYDYPSDCAMRIQQPGGESGLHASTGGLFDPLVWVQQIHTACRTSGINVDIVGPDADLGGYKQIIVGCAAIATVALVDNLKSCSARVLLLPRSGSKTENHGIPSMLAPGLLQSLLPITVVRAESLPPQILLTANSANKVVSSSLWREHIASDLEPLGRFEDGWGFHYQSGRFDYLNAWLEPESLREFIASRLIEAKITTHSCDEGLRLRRLGNIQFAFNYGPYELDLQVAGLGSNQFILGQTVLGPGDLAAWLAPPASPQ